MFDLFKTSVNLKNILINGTDLACGYSKIVKMVFKGLKSGNTAVR